MPKLLIVASCLIASAASAGSAAAQQPSGTIPRAGLVITTSTTLAPGRYLLPARASMDSAVIVVRGDDITVDMAGVQLVGAPEGSDPDRGAGVAILVDGGTNVTIRNATIRGYKIAIRARGTRGLRLLDNDLSFNWKPRLFSIVEHESLADWLSFHQNDKDEWLRHGGAIYLRDVRGGEIRGNTVRQGMNGLMMANTDSLLVWNNDFSFNSGLGIGMYRADHNRIMHNKVDYNVRGYSEGFYRRGQDSAGILMYQQCDSNVVAHNSVTHGGDGVFIWAGQHTMDTGEGGVNDNLFYRNDFSWAPTNGIETTFSRNVFVENTVIGSDYGVWGGYSYNSLFAGNRFARNRIGLAIEHGQDNRIIGNTFDGDSTTISLWANRIEPSDWGYPRHRDTRSRDYGIADNVMQPVRVALRIRDTRGVSAERNTIRVSGDSALVLSGDTSGFRLVPAAAGEARSRYDVSRYAVPPLAGGMDPFTRYSDWPRSTIIVDEWGPYDWTAPRLWPVDSSLSTPLKLRVLGAPPTPTPAEAGGAWQLVEARGARVSRQSGRIGDTVVVTPDAGGGAVEDWTIRLAQGPHVFAYSRFDARPRWNVTVYAWTDSVTHPVDSAAAFAALLRGERGAPALSFTSPRLDYMWYRPPARVQGWPQERAGVAATAEVDLPAGRYVLRTISDDGIRVYVDDRLVIEDWSVHESRIHEAPLNAGRHRIRVEYFQRDGWTELRAELLKRD
ncbi:MAG: right-handed parallel beta-helix repeat-containing protein [Gemmatimonadaceae bacterium]